MIIPAMSKLRNRGKSPPQQTDPKNKFFHAGKIGHMNCFGRRRESGWKQCRCTFWRRPDTGRSVHNGWCSLIVILINGPGSHYRACPGGRCQWQYTCICQSAYRLMIKIRKDLRIISQIFFYPWSYDQQLMKKNNNKATRSEPADSVHIVDESYHAESPKVG